MTLATVLVNALFLALLGVSLLTAWFWGEMAGIPKGGDKSGLGGLMAVMLFMALRWVGVAVVLWLAVARGGLTFVPGGYWRQVALVLGIHLALGIVSMVGFSAVSEGLTHDKMDPQRWSWFFGIVLPIPALVIAWLGINPGIRARSPMLTLGMLLAIVALHAGCFRSNLVEMRKRHDATVPSPSPGP